MTAPYLDDDEWHIMPVHDQSGRLRNANVISEPWWFAQDLAKPLGMQHIRVQVHRLDASEKGFVTLSNGTEGNPKRSIVSESGLWVSVTHQW